MRIWTAAAIKGGTGKTSTTAALAQAAVADGQRVLAIDLDPQANLTFALAGDLNAAGSYQLLHGADPLQLLQQTAQGIFLLSASPDLSAERTKTASGKRLQAALQPLENEFDLAVIDTPPMMGELTFNALQATKDLIIPLETDAHSLQGLYSIVDIANHIRNTNPALRIAGAVLTRFDPRPKINRFIRDTIADKESETGAPLLSTIRNGIAVREAQALQLSLFEYAPKSKPAQDYMTLYRKMMEV